MDQEITDVMAKRLSGGRNQRSVMFWDCIATMEGVYVAGGREESASSETVQWPLGCHSIHAFTVINVYSWRAATSKDRRRVGRLQVEHELYPLRDK